MIPAILAAVALIIAFRLWREHSRVNALRRWEQSQRAERLRRVFGELKENT